MKLTLVISGGQTGADRTGLECAKALGLETGGTVPKGCRTDMGPDPSLITEFGCVESVSSSYPPRTAMNVKDSHATVWFGDVTSPGGRLTKRLCRDYNRPFIENPTSLVQVAEEYAIINIAGNRQRTNPAVVERVRAAFRTLILRRPFSPLSRGEE